MLHLKSKKILSALCVILLVFLIAGSKPAHAEAMTNLPTSMHIVDENGIQIQYDGEYHINAEDLKPGDVVTKTLVIHNLSQNNGSREWNIPFRLAMTAQPISTNGPVDLLDAVSLELRLDNEIVYSGRSRGDDHINMIENAVDLGRYQVGERRDLHITLTVDSDMTVHEDGSEALFRWVFYAYRDMSEVPPQTPPKTGVLTNYWRYMLPIGGMMLIGITLLMLNRHQQKRHRYAVRAVREAKEN